MLTIKYIDASERNILKFIQQLSKFSAIKQIDLISVDFQVCKIFY